MKRKGSGTRRRGGQVGKAVTRERDHPAGIAGVTHDGGFIDARLGREKWRIDGKLHEESARLDPSRIGVNFKRNARVSKRCWMYHAQPAETTDTSQPADRNAASAEASSGSSSIAVVMSSIAASPGAAVAKIKRSASKCVIRPSRYSAQKSGASAGR